MQCNAESWEAAERGSEAMQRPADLSLLVSSLTSFLLCGSKLMKSDMRWRDLQGKTLVAYAALVTRKLGCFKM
jgi:hypothetical protein